MSHFISIICPIRNEARYIEKCLHSILQQDFAADRYEILVIDGLSEDGTRERVEWFCRRYPQVLLYDNPQQTAPYAMNIGLAHAKGDVLVRVDGHAFLAPDYLKMCEHLLAATAADCVGGVIKSITTTVTGQDISAAMSSVFGIGNARFRTSGKAGDVDTLAFGAYRSSVFQRVGVFDEQLTRCQDDEFNYRLRKAGMKIYFDPAIVAYYYPRQSLAGLWRQYFGYGLWKVRVLQKHPSMMRIRQFVPVVFVTSLLFCAVAGWFQPLWFAAGAGILLLYGLANLAFSIRLIWQRKAACHPRIALVFCILHFSYGLGFIRGLVRFAPWFFRRETNLDAASPAAGPAMPAPDHRGRA
jgi:succinoglycan biosynthesis protein ExoA